MQRQIKACHAHAQPLLQEQKNLYNVQSWFEQQAQIHPALQMRWFLAHADDGVIWGEVRDGSLITSDSVTCVSPKLRVETLQQARLFSPSGEVLLWRDGDNHWNARLLFDSVKDQSRNGEATWIEAFDEAHMLWGTHGEPCENRFTLLRDGAQGLRHCLPMELRLNHKGETRPPRLQVRHYLARDDFARVAASRLVDLIEDEAGAA